MRSKFANNNNNNDNNNNDDDKEHTHTHKYIYIYIYNEINFIVEIQGERKNNFFRFQFDITSKPIGKSSKI